MYQPKQLLGFALPSLLLISMCACCSPTTAEEKWNQSWEIQYQEYRDHKRKVQTPQEAIELLRLALKAKGITYRPHIFTNMPRWEEAVYGAFLEMPYPMVRSHHQQAVENYMKQLGYRSKGMSSKREIAQADQEKILAEFARLLGTQANPSAPAVH